MMVYRRRKSGGGYRPSYYFDGRVPTASGWKQICTYTPDRKLGQRIEAMWAELAERHRAWDVLGRVLDGGVPIGRLYDLWTKTRADVEEIRRRLEDVDVVPTVEEFLTVYRARGNKPDTEAHVEAHLRWLFPEGAPVMRSAVTTHWLTERLTAYPAEASTRRKVHSSWSVFFAYLADVRRWFPRNPMDLVARPKRRKLPPRFYELDAVERIVGAQPTAERRALFAFLYGTGVEISVALGLTRADVWPQSREVRAPGTKAHTRDRVARVADWAWPALWAHANALHPQAPLFPAEWNRWTASDWHRETVLGLELAPALPMQNARHHWAVRRLRSGSSIYDVQRQLGHESPQLTLETYGQFMPSAEDRDRAEAKATEYETNRRAAK